MRRAVLLLVLVSAAIGCVEEEREARRTLEPVAAAGEEEKIFGRHEKVSVRRLVRQSTWNDISGVFEVHDDEHKVTCWVAGTVGPGISCLRDAESRK